jgi:anti-sigma28 factor (negative regulator of flagellin synthesis)
MDIDDVQGGGTKSAGESRAGAVGPSYWAEAVQEARGAGLDVPDVQTDRVDALRSRIRTGDLVPDPDRIAKALLGQGVVDA